MANAPEQSRNEIAGLPADEEAVRRYAHLDSQRQAALVRVARVAGDVASANRAALSIAWWVDAEVEGWEEFVIQATPPDAAADLPLLRQLAVDVEEERQLIDDPIVREWVLDNVVVTTVTR